MRALILLAAVASLYLAFRWFLRQPRRTQLQVAAVTVGVALIVLAATGRLNWVFALFGALLPFLRRLVPLMSYLPAFQRVFRRFKSPQSKPGPSTGQQSRVETRFLSMILDHDTGEMNGSVLKGRFAGKALKELSLDREQSEAGRDATGSSDEMTRREAYEILGLDEGASEEQIIEAHRRLMQRVHPDRGGSTFLAIKINQAKRRLLSDG